MLTKLESDMRSIGYVKGNAARIAYKVGQYEGESFIADNWYSSNPAILCPAKPMAVYVWQDFIIIGAYGYGDFNYVAPIMKFDCVEDFSRYLANNGRVYASLPSMPQYD